MTSVQLSAGFLSLLLFETDETSGVVTRCEDLLDTIDNMISDGFNPESPANMTEFAEKIRDIFANAGYDSRDPEEIAIARVHRFSIDYAAVAELLVAIAALRRNEPNSYECLMRTIATKMTRNTKRRIAEKRAAGKSP